MTPAVITLAPEAASVRAARQFVASVLAEAGAAAAADDVQTLVSELATNAVLHARSEYTIEVLCDTDVVRVVVADQSLAPVRVRAYANDSTTGRGMRLLATMASRWGVEPEAAGKRVWFEIPAAGSEPVADWHDQGDVDSILSAFDDLSDDDDLTDVGQTRALLAA